MSSISARRGDIIERRICFFFQNRFFNSFRHCLSARTPSEKMLNLCFYCLVKMPLRRCLHDRRKIFRRTIFIDCRLDIGIHLRGMLVQCNHDRSLHSFYFKTDNRHIHFSLLTIPASPRLYVAASDTSRLKNSPYKTPQSPRPISAHRTPRPRLPRRRSRFCRRLCA